MKFSSYVEKNISYELGPDKFRTIALGDVLSFLSGADAIPPMGFQIQPSIEFTNGTLPKSSTCVLVMRLPTQNQDYKTFRDRVTYALLNHGGLVKCDILGLLRGED